MRAFLLIAIAACGGSSSAPSAPPTPSLVTPHDTASDLQVATVNGRPVWGSCVARQGNLADCIAFELLAQAAEAKGLARDPDVVAATRTAEVDRLIATEFEAKVASFADLHGVYDSVIEKNAFRMHRPDLRTSAYVRAPVDEKAPPEVDAKAHAAAEAVAAELRDQTGLFPISIDEVADKVGAAARVTLERAEVPIKPREALAKPYADVLWAIPEVGRIGGPVRTKWGWDVILYTGGLPPLETTREQLVDELFPELRRHYFIDWVETLRKSLGITVEIDAAQLEGS